MWTDLNRPPLDADALRKALVRGDDEGSAGGDPRAFWSRLDVVQETGSTNADLLSRAAHADCDRHVLLAEFQGSGRGRHSRAWVSPPQAQIAVSALLTMPGMSVGDMGWLPLLTGVAVVDAVRAVAKVPAELKWPNDVLIDGRKVAGILAEVATTTPDPAVVVGIGINVTLARDELPVPHATSLMLEGAEVTDRNTLVRAVLRAIAGRWQQWHDTNWDVTDLADAYRARCGTLGQRVRAELPGGTELLGIATDIDTEGRVVIAPDGRADTVAVSAGDITHLRPVRKE
ncbi:MULTISPECIES: biotin--[acetyl-CoA-carboxylase] ligase [Rhodococcus]|uniref:biotin--[biotin carboxyl-carrier protein] ligase n=1 Tax=Rhodococcus oxybenzonivorans TaxID=1990687 RepID=A0AAE4V5I4_9NOCA|nr:MULTISPECIES: biotin--[acetyl-CoA-carboxylase] ligase [Rhodococcus]MDV7244579.1 biotin--[acetyl-CoA-carboxylase] ligase [Rhodococcus oxybenzonivorans]MDV7268617.1 biotin--[acetyl-CoA-carboxylase] ligase [Rhodococcus oxybenzonivorans]MDV7275920.1 biotin--[acetyl-CoA-carboxylase] ligase [Rhodococcus oxybenzonivorans]MDV7332699.1 biotin--[acetyl-CoA-carboxylase] ligase [Rhodococcus oxybenzonivorans]MDV7346495.1 biotin--[acetyl-CoA-carboxylase] ligase [Rhodococcus oxybenzonivorans]